MIELRKIAMQFVSHRMSAEEFAMAVLAEIVLARNDGRKMIALADSLLNMQAGSGEG